MRAMTMKVNRAEAIRLVGAAIRTKTQEFERKKRLMPKRLEHARNIVAKAAEKRLKEVLQAQNVAKLRELAREDLLSWEEVKDFPEVPQLNVCSLKNLLLLLQNDVRKNIPISSDHELWSVLEGKCEVIYGK